MRSNLKKLAEEFDRLFHEVRQEDKFSNFEIRKKRKRMREIMIKYAELEEKLGIKRFVPPEMGGKK